jgi:general secretion pathway protein M
MQKNMSGLKQQFHTFWGARNERERLILIGGTGIVAIALIYSALINPALAGRKELEAKLPELRMQAAEVAQLAREAAAAGNASTVPFAVVTKESVAAQMERAGLKAQNLALTGDILRVDFSSASYAAVVGWLTQMHREGRFSVLDARIEPLSQSDMVKASFTLQKQAATGA